jgi:hypothetical protein
MVVCVAEFIAAVGHAGDLPAGAIIQKHLCLVTLILVHLLPRAYDTYHLSGAPPLVVCPLLFMGIIIWLSLYNEKVGGTQPVLAVEGTGQTSGGARCEERERDDFVDGLRTTARNHLVQL